MSFVRQKTFAVIGVAGFVAPRHLSAIHAVGGRLVAATDPHDVAGVLDRYSFDVRFFPEIERFDRHLEKLRRGPEEHRLDYVSICSPNYLHDAHIRLALRGGADAICEKPLVINPWNVGPLEELERETGKRVYPVLQLRGHEGLRALRAKIISDVSGKRHQVQLTYVTARGPWYSAAWKGNPERSGGLLANIGVHLFDVLLWLFGSVQSSSLKYREADRAAGELILKRADVRWSLSTRHDDLPRGLDKTAVSFREMKVDDDAIEFSEGFTALHTKLYEEIVSGRGLTIADARPSIELVHTLRNAHV